MLLGLGTSEECSVGASCRCFPPVISSNDCPGCHFLSYVVCNKRHRKSINWGTSCVFRLAKDKYVGLPRGFFVIGSVRRGATSRVHPVSVCE